MSKSRNDRHHRRSQVEILQSTPSRLFLDAHQRHAGVHADQNRRHATRTSRQQSRREERDARLGNYRDDD